MRLKKPGNECFNCLSTSHKIQDCPIELDKERIEMHRKNFASQSMAAQEQAQLFANRYTSDDKLHRGFIPGQISDNLRDALGISKKQIPPYIYLMRELGYPPGWLAEAQVKQSGITVVGGEPLKKENENGEVQESGEIQCRKFF